MFPRVLRRRRELSHCLSFQKIILPCPRRFPTNEQVPFEIQCVVQSNAFTECRPKIHYCRMERCNTLPRPHFGSSLPLCPVVLLYNTCTFDFRINMKNNVISAHRQLFLKILFFFFRQISRRFKL